MKHNKLIHSCIACGGSGWYDANKKWGCFRCGGLQYPSVKGTGVDPMSSTLCILEEVFPQWIGLDEAVDKTITYTGWSNRFVRDFLNGLYKKGHIVIENGKAINHIELQ